MSIAVRDITHPGASRRPSVTACSICLSVLLDDEWVAAEDAIRRLRTYDSPSVVALEPALCDLCIEAVDARRAG
jgi:hypothetical protein